jgi:hypothetical protein
LNRDESKIREVILVLFDKSAYDAHVNQIR